MTQPFVLEACSSSLTIAIVRRCLDELRVRDQKCSVVRCHMAQEAAWEDLGVIIGAIKFNPKEFPEFEPITLGGIPMETNNSLDKSKILFLDGANQVIAEIRSLAIPSAFVE